MSTRPGLHPRGLGDEAGPLPEWALGGKSWEMLTVSSGVMPPARGTGPLPTASSQRRELSPAQKCPMSLLIPLDFSLLSEAGTREARPGGPRVAQGWCTWWSHCRATSRYSSRYGQWWGGGWVWDTGRQRVTAQVPQEPP